METGGKYKCKKCNSEIEVTKGGKGTPVCCGKEMQKLPKTDDNPIKIKMSKDFEELRKNLLDMVEFGKDAFFKKTVLIGDSSEVELICLKNVQVTPEHTHKDLEHILLVLDGQGQIRYADEKYDIKMGDVILIPAGEKHSLISLEDSQLIVASINFLKQNSI